jgi:choline dehydrogenase-like flavoprotein
LSSKAETDKTAPKADQRTECDVIILGAGIGGSITGAILARQGAKVVLVDAGQHPRFAVGESQNPQLVEWLHILAVRYDVPEIKHLLDAKAVTKYIGAHHGRKQSFGFVRHVADREPDPREATMFVIPKMLTEASHMYRQDTDSYYFNVAAKYGCTLRQNWRATDLDFDDDGVTVTGQNGEVSMAGASCGTSTTGPNGTWPPRGSRGTARCMAASGPARTASSHSGLWPVALARSQVCRTNSLVSMTAATAPGTGPQGRPISRPRTAGSDQTDFSSSAPAVQALAHSPSATSSAK